MRNVHSHRRFVGMPMGCSVGCGGELVGRMVRLHDRLRVKQRIVSRMSRQLLLLLLLFAAQPHLLHGKKFTICWRSGGRGGGSCCCPRIQFPLLLQQEPNALGVATSVLTATQGGERPVLSSSNCCVQLRRVSLQVRATRDNAVGKTPAPQRSRDCVQRLVEAL